MYRLTAYFLNNISAKNYQNCSMFMKVIANQSSVVFYRQCMCTDYLYVH